MKMRAVFRFLDKKGAGEFEFALDTQLLITLYETVNSCSQFSRVNRVLLSDILSNRTETDQSTLNLSCTAYDCDITIQYTDSGCSQQVHQSQEGS